MNTKDHLRTEIFDLIQYLFGEFKYNDHQIHCVIKLEGKVDEKRLRQAALLSMEIVPVLSSRFVPNNHRPYWERIGRPDYERGIAFVETDDPDTEVSRFLTSRTDELTGPQIRTTIVRGRQDDFLCFVVNHMVCDAAGFKQYLYLLNDIYEGLRNNPGYSPTLQNDGSRGLGQIYRQFGLFKRVRVLLLPPVSNKDRLSLAEGAEQYGTGPLKSFVNIFKIPPHRFAGLRQYCTLKEVTINDAVLAAYFRTVFRLLEDKTDITLSIPCTIDLRRYLAGERAAAICNLSSWIRAELTLKTRESFDDTVVNVHREMESRKNHYPGLDGFGLLSLVFKLLPYSRAKGLVRSGIKSPLITMTNLGIIEKDRLTFGGQPGDAFMTASNKYPPYFQLSFSTYDNAITFSVNLPDTSDNQALATRFWDLFEKELPAKTARV